MHGNNAYYSQQQCTMLIEKHCFEEIKCGFFRVCYFRAFCDCMVMGQYFIDKYIEKLSLFSHWHCGL